ncbi:MAG: TetR/AcrR family transcriptional regulator [Proteobacteria bacterium]|nr:TetR/AcrR family transcriptional regulator [Pseudomonadota bacterium]
MPRKAGDNAQTPDPRVRAVDALMTLAAAHEWNAITLPMIAEEAGLSLADLRDLFPSKGAMLGGFIRRIDRITLEGRAEDLADSPARERVLDLMLRRFDALLPYRAALGTIHNAFRSDLAGLLALNQQALNSWRYLLASAGIETEGPMGFLKLQGAILVFARIFPVFLDDEDEGLTRTMAALDRELSRGEWVLARAEGIDRFFAPLRGFCRAAKQAREERRHAPGEADAA